MVFISCSLVSSLLAVNCLVRLLLAFACHSFFVGLHKLWKLSKSVKKSDVLSINEEFLTCKTNHPSRINNRFCYFCTRDFFIRGEEKLSNVGDSNFTFHVNASRTCLK